jgi:hypothetical protein
MLPPQLEQTAFRSSNGEFGWTRQQISSVVHFLSDRGLAILGGELWWVRDDGGTFGLIPQRVGAPALYAWETQRLPGESWQQFVERSAADSLSAVGRWPAVEDLPTDMRGQILYNLCWTSEGEYREIVRKI